MDAAALSAYAVLLQPNAEQLLQQLLAGLVRQGTLHTRQCGKKGRDPTQQLRLDRAQWCASGAQLTFMGSDDAMVYEPDQQAGQVSRPDDWELP